MNPRFNTIWASIVTILLLSLMIPGCASKRLRVPKVKSDIRLDYPLAAQLERLEGEVMLAVFVNKKGEVEQVELLQSSGHEELDEAALQFTKTLQYNPGTVDDKPVDAWSKLLLNYKLTEVPFNDDQWFRDVLYYQSRVEDAQDSLAREQNLRRLFTHYRGLSAYVERNPQQDINFYIRQVITDASDDRWSDFWSRLAAPFVVYDDFLRRYPNCSFADQVQEQLIEELIKVKHQLRVKALRSTLSKTLLRMIDQVESRLEELNQAVGQSPAL
jgi:TonB family protein